MLQLWLSKDRDVEFGRWKAECGIKGRKQQRYDECGRRNDLAWGMAHRAERYGIRKLECGRRN
jgi:hypothetical protein